MHHSRQKNRQACARLKITHTRCARVKYVRVGQLSQHAEIEMRIDQKPFSRMESEKEDAGQVKIPQPILPAELTKHRPTVEFWKKMKGAEKVSASTSRRKTAKAIHFASLQKLFQISDKQLELQVVKWRFASLNQFRKLLSYTRFQSKFSAA